MTKFIDKKNNIELVMLFLVVIIASFFRLWQIGQMPPGFSADEATIGYNAYSVLQTGRDEYGKFLPLSFKSFSDYQAPLYTYITIPFIVIFGLTELAVRLPSALFGIATVILVYLLLLRLFQDKKLALISAFFLAISPWHVFFSRGAWQTNLATFWMTLGIYLFVVALDKRKVLPLSVLAFSTSLYAYQSQRLIVPLLGLLLAIFYWRQLISKLKPLIISAVLGFIILIPMIFILASPAGQARFKGVSVFTDIGPVNRINQLRGEHLNPNDLIVKGLHNKVQTFSTIIAKNYFEHFNPKFLFIDGDPIGSHNIPDFGVLYPFDVILLLFGLVYCIQKKRFDRSRIILLWLAVAPVASAITFQAPNALRAENMSVPLAIISAFGALLIIESFSRMDIYVKYAFSTISCVLVAYFMVVMLHQYYVHLPKRHGLDWEYGFGKMIKSIENEQADYSKVVITNRYDQPYILTLFYLRFNPKLYQTIAKKETEIDKFGFTTIASFNKFEFRKINWGIDSKTKDIILVATPEEVPENVKVDKIIYFPNGKPAFLIIKT